MPSRRNVLKALGATVLTATSGAAIAHSAYASNHIETSGKVIKIFTNVNHLIRDINLKKGDFVKTAGYHQVNDGGHAEYLVATEQDEHQTGIALENGMFALLINVGAVNYKMFGTLSNGTHDDGIEIKKAHQYANARNLPVLNFSGEFWLKASHSIPILNSVEWGNTVFHIDEKFNTAQAYKFVIASKKKKPKGNFTAAEKANIIQQFKPGAEVVNEFSSLAGHLLYIEDTNDRIGFRSGDRFKGQSWAKQELVYIEEHGKIVGEVAYTFNDFTNLEIIPVDDSYLTINGGCFMLSGDSSGRHYVKNGLGILRSRTIISNQIVRLADGKKDIANNARTGFYNFSKVYDVTLENIRLIPYEQNREGTENDVSSGTYGISGSRILNATFKNVTADGSSVHWGVFGTNMNKNFKIDSCHLNRVDVHFHCWNLTILNSRIGTKGITITGGGNLTIQNTICENRSFVAFRRDFGAKWDGDIKISNCKHIPAASSSNTLLVFNPANFNYKYPIVFGRSITIENMVIDLTNSTSKVPYYLMNMCSFSKMKHGERIIFPKAILFRNIIVHGENKGVRLLTLYQPNGYYVSAKGFYDEIELQTNSKILVENVDLEDFSSLKRNAEGPYHILVKNDEAITADSHSLFPQIEIINGASVAVNLSGLIAKLIIRNSHISTLKTTEKDIFKGEIHLSECKVLPKVADKKDIKLEVNTTLATIFTNCTIHSPQVNGKFEPSLLNQYNFIKINETLRFNHSNTMLGKDILNHLKSQNKKLTPQFIAMLKAHSSLED